MSTKLHWQPYQPSKKNPWNARLAAHLFRRAGFGATRKELDQAVKQGPQKTVDSLFENAAKDTDQPFQILRKQVRSGGNLERLPNYWLYRMVKTDAQLLEKTTLFWHGHFATSAAKVDEVALMLDQNELLRKNALGNFTPMVQGISKDPAMLIYLDSKVNRKTRPNENYARELMELFCLGLGNYTEEDIKQVARTFTGWEVRNDQFKFNKYQHDYGVKRFLGSSGEFSGEQAVEIVLKQKSSTEFIARKLINFFVTDMPVSESVVSGLAATLRDNEFNIGMAVKKILLSQMFYDSVGQKIKSPVELAVGLMRSMDATGNFVQLSQRLDDLGQLPFYPPNVKGWPGGRTWINSATLLARINLVSELLSDETTKFDGKTLSQWGRNQASEISDFDMYENLELLLLAKPAPTEVKQRIKSILKGRDGLKRAIVAIASLPEFQLA